ncbi:MAG TPA: tetratricopeptide repeat protein [Thermoanaerobaculia bacterium]|nr:tetratricopeptide repeat protein [Thermoanaerobaculia bacterium]
MKTPALIFLVALAFAPNAAPQDTPSGPYDFVMAKLAAEEGRYDEALTRMDRVIEKEPSNPVLLFERAMMLVDSGRADRAEAELKKLVEAHPEFYDAQRALGRVLLDRAGNDHARLDEALVHLQAAYKANPDDLSSGVTVSQLLVASGRVAEAEKVLASLVERAPDQRVLNYNYAQVLTKLGRGDESKQYLERAVLLDPTFGPAVLQLVDIYQRESEWEKAAQVLQPLIEQDPMNVELQRQQAYFWLRAGSPERARGAFKALVDADPKDARSLFYLAESLSDLEQYEEAEKIYRKLLEQTPNDADLLASFGLTQVAQRKFDDAEHTFRSLLAVKDVPDNLVALAKTQLAVIELQRGHNEAAANAAKEILIFRDKPNSQAVGIAVEALRKEKKYREALELLQPLVDKFASDAFVNARYVEMLVRTGEKDKARAAAVQQAKFGTRNAVASAEALIQGGEGPAAIAMINDALKSKTDDIDLQFELGSAYERAGDHLAAERAFLNILQKNPEHAATLNYLGYMWADSNVNLERAAEMLARAVKQEPRNGAYVDSLGWVYFRQGKLELAEKYLTDASRLLPRDATVHEHLGDVFAKRGNYKRALDLYRVALSLEPEPKDEVKLRSKIAEVEKQQTAQR